MKSIIISGVGGQGVLTASDLLSDVLLEEGYDVKKSEVHGMSQRGGDVISTIRYGTQVFSPLPSLYETDYILSFEKLEALRNINYLSKDGVIMVNDYVWEPLPVAAGFEKYPENIEETLKKYAARVIMVPATDIAVELGNIRATNVVLVGVLAANMDIAKNIWVNVVRRKVPPKFIDLNIEAFEKGYKYKL
ncbi:MAG: indolepyruvate oxidoreductase subunit beta [Candidatus Aminicenantes bacterium]|nr:indolepyruvate oxidoreductase subunit beta [Candidatus Aminicenantes bacterium]